LSKLGVIKHLDVEPALLDYDDVLNFIDNTKFSRVKTKYSKGDDWTAISLRGYGPTPLDILKPNVLKSKVNESAELQDTDLLSDLTDKTISLPLLYSTKRSKILLLLPSP